MPKTGSKHTAWTKDQEKFLSKNWERLTAPEIARHIDKTAGATYRRANMLGLRKRNYTRKEATNA